MRRSTLAAPEEVVELGKVGEEIGQVLEGKEEPGEEKAEQQEGVLPDGAGEQEVEGV